MFRAVKLTKNADLNKHFYSGYGIGFGSRSLISIPNFNWGKNAIICEVNMNFSMHSKKIKIS